MERTKQLITSFASKGLVHGSIHEEWGYDMKYEQCILLLRCYLPRSNDCIPFNPLTLDDFILSIEKAQLQDILVHILSNFHPFDVIDIAKRFYLYHQTFPLRTNSRKSTLEVFAYLLTLFVCVYDPNERNKLERILFEEFHECECLHRLKMAFKSTTIQIESSCKIDPKSMFILERMLKAQEMPIQIPVTELLCSFANDIRSTCDGNCQHLPSITSIPQERYLQDLLPFTPDQLVPVLSNEEDWYADCIDTRMEGFQTFTRLISLNKWNETQIEWIRSHLCAFDDVHVLSIHVGSVLHAPAAAQAIVDVSLEVQTLFNFATPETTPHSFLCLAAWSPLLVINELVRHGLVTPENRRVYTNVLSILLPLCPVAISLPRILWQAATNVKPPPHHVAQWAESFLHAALTPMSEMCLDCFLPFVETDTYYGWFLLHSSLGQSTHHILCDEAAEKVVMLAIEELRRQWIKQSEEVIDLTSMIVTVLKNQFPAGYRHPSIELVQANDCSRLRILFDPTCSSFPSVDALKFSDRDLTSLMDVLWGAVYGSTICIETLKELATESIEWESHILFLIHQLGPSMSSSQFKVFSKEIFPILLPQVPTSPYVISIPNQPENSISVEWNRSFWLMHCISKGILVSEHVHSLRHLTFALEEVVDGKETDQLTACFGLLTVLLHAPLNDSLKEQLKVHCNQVLTSIKSRMTKIQVKYLHFCIDQIHDDSIRKQIRRLMR